MGVTFNSVIGRLYGVEYKDDLLHSVWQMLTNDIEGTGVDMEVTDSENVGRRFYRIRVRLE